MVVLRTVQDIERWGRERAGETAAPCVLVPTMGALHAGHAALIRHGVGLAGRLGLPGGCVATIFVNPAQFNDPRDYERYPRTEDADLAVCRDAGAAAVFAPDADTVYPPGAAAELPPLPRVATHPGLEDAHRPGHFAGVCRVVLRLFRLLRPRAAVFGEKDWQQLRVVTAMADALALGVRIEPFPTAREHDGLAMSSRNRFLTPDERSRAAAISRALCDAGAHADAPSAQEHMRAALAAAGLQTEYAVVRDAATLEAEPSGGPRRALIAARAGSTRLIDNAPWTPAVR